MDAVFSQINDGIKADPSLLQKVNGVYLFKIGDASYTVDVKNAGKGVTKGAEGKPDITVTVAEPDFMSLVSGKANGQQLFMSGKIKISGNMGLAMKLDQVMKSKPAAAAAAPAASSAATGVGAVFDKINAGIKADASLLQKVNGVFLFKIGSEQFTVDVKNAGKGVSKGAEGKADVTITVAEPDFLALVAGKANGQQLFMQGKIKMAGNMGLAMKMDQVMKSAGPSAKL